MNFTYHGCELTGYDHPYNTTAHNERAVELAVAFDWLPDGDGLEVGNVLSHYTRTAHRIVDLHEQAPGVENLSVFDIEGSYDWVLSISTLEHVHHDTEPRNPDASAAALAHLRSLLRPSGRMLVTVPLGYHPHFDRTLLTGAGADRSATLIRDNGTWKQTRTLTTRPYGASTPWAEAVWIGEYTPERTST